VPTARELLDQADALMRRNRLASAPAPEDGIPTLIDAVPMPPEVPDPELSAARSAAPVPPRDLDDVPLLTDAVEEIEAPSILDEPPDPDDPSMWTDTLTGAHTIIPPVPIDLPPARADTLGVGVLPEEWGAGPGAPPLAVETIDLAPAAPEPEESAPWQAPEPRPVGEDADAPPPPLESFPAQAIEPDAPAAGARDLPPPPDAEPLPLPVDIAEPAAPEPAEDTLAAAAYVDSAGGDEAQPATPFEWPSQAEAPPADAMAAQAAAASAAAAAAEQARWSALAEEVRMQVLQRIDLFTDTGLREQLAARLQPIVDRASADLVATINQHVGVLLRAYVAEAIEREIERWRADGR
jgi:hypothetical protein